MNGPLNPRETNALPHIHDFSGEFYIELKLGKKGKKKCLPFAICGRKAFLIIYVLN
jgi:hypothetical protein